MINKICLLLLILFPEILIAQTPEKDDVKFLEKRKFLISFEGGITYQTGDSKPATESLVSSGLEQTTVDNYFKKLKKGQFAGASVHYLISDNWGIGVAYRIFSNRSKMMGYAYSQDYTAFYGPVSEKTYINFIGPSFYYNDKMRAKRWTFLSTFAAGMALYRDEMNLVIAPALITGFSPAIHFGLGFEYSLYKNISAAVDLSGFFASLQKFKLNDGQTKTEIDLGDQKENLTRINLSTGIHYRF